MKADEIVEDFCNRYDPDGFDESRKFNDELTKIETINKKMGFNVGYELGYNKGIHTILRLLKMNELQAGDLLKVISNKWQNNNMKNCFLLCNDIPGVAKAAPFI